MRHARSAPGFRLRARESLERVIARGDVVTEVSVGYVRIGRGMEMTPDEQVRQAIQSVFAKFSELGSARQVVLWYRQEGIQLPFKKRELDGFEIGWRAPLYSQILSILRNPVYSGAFAYGKTTLSMLYRASSLTGWRGARV